MAAMPGNFRVYDYVFDYIFSTSQHMLAFKVQGLYINAISSRVMTVRASRKDSNASTKQLKKGRKNRTRWKEH